MIGYFKGFNSPAQRLSASLFTEVTGSGWLAELTHKVTAANKEGGDYQYLKRKLPAITWQAVFSEGDKRKNELATPSGLFMLDVDHVDDPDALYRKISAEHAAYFVPALWDSLFTHTIVVAHKTPSGKGLRLVAIADPVLTIAANQAALAESLGLKDIYDPVTKDMARLSFLVSSDYFYFYNPHLFEYVEDFVTNKKYEGCQLGVACDYGTLKNTSTEAKFFAKSQTEGSDPLICKFAKESKDLHLQIVEELVASMGGTPEEGERNTRLYALARKVRYIADFSLNKVMALMPDWGLPEDEVRQTVASAIASTRSERMPSDVYAIKTRLEDSTIAEDEEAAKSKALPPLPPIFKELVSIAPDDFKVPTIMALLPVVGTLCSRLRAKYLDGKMHSPSFITCIVAPQASGKSFATDLVKTCTRGMSEKDKAARVMEDAWAQMAKMVKNVKELPPEPKCIIRKVPASISVAKLLKRLSNAQGLHLLSFLEEMDTLTKSNKSGAWAEKSDIYRNAFDNAEYGQDYMSDNSYSTVVNVYYNMLLCGTPNAMARFFKDVEDGLLSRVCFVELVDQFGKEMPVWKEMSARDKESLMTLCDNVDEKLNLGSESAVLPEYKVDDLGAVNEAIQMWLEQKREVAVRSGDVALDTYRRRAAVIGFRAAFMAQYLSQTYGEGRQVRTPCKDAADFGVFVADEVLDMLMRRYGEELTKILVTTKRNSVKRDDILTVLPTEFSKYDVQSALTQRRVKTPIKNLIYLWKKAGYIEEFEVGRYRTLKTNNNE